jgi:hypothetical protein
MTARRCRLAGVCALAALAGISACAVTRGSHPAAPPDSTPVSAGPSAPAPPETAAPPELTPRPQPVPVPQKVPEEQAPPAAAADQLPPCMPVPPKTHRKRKGHAKEPQGPEPPSPAQTRTDTVVDAQVGQLGISLTSILGKNVVGPKGERFGRVVDVLADDDGRVRAAIIDFGGFLGVGIRRIAVDWPLLRFNPNARDKPLMLTVTREKLQSAPEYKDSMSPRVLMPPAAAAQDAADTGETKK